jgi:hypothetical protein
MIIGPPIHADSWNGDSRTLCGEAFEGEDGKGSVMLVNAREVVTCEDCKRVIAYCQDVYTTNYRRRAPHLMPFLSGAK